MDAIGDYSSDSDSEQRKHGAVDSSNVVRRDRSNVHAAPTVSLTKMDRPNSDLALCKNENETRDQNLQLFNNPKKSLISQPMEGPQGTDPSTQTSKSLAGQIQNNVFLEEALFSEQRTSFQRSGYAVDPTGETVLRSTIGYSQNRLKKFSEIEEQRRKRPRLVNVKGEVPLVNGSDDEAEYGVWGPPDSEEKWTLENSCSDFKRGELLPEQEGERAYFAELDRQRGKVEDRADEESAQDRLVERKMAHLLPPKVSEDGPTEATTTFHGEEEFDYREKSWMDPPPGLGNLRADGGRSEHRCFVPTKCVHRFTGHSKGVHRIRLFPITGHLILSAGLDGLCKVWSVEDKKLKRTYSGHAAAVRDVQFNHDGSKFVSASFDRYLRLWSTESGQLLQTLSNKKVPYVVQFYPHDDNFVVVGCSDSKIVTYNVTTAEITQEYNHHLGPVNAIIFVEDNGTKMVTTGDDKKVLVWEWDIGVPIKYISDPSMQSMPCLVLHPSHRFFAAQSLDNTICVFQAGNKYAMQKKKKFSGHIVSGYACEMSFSPDGQFLSSGDGNGALFFWDWKKHKILQKYRAHTGGPTIDCVWHPLQPSTMFSCGWDGIIKMWS